MEIKDLIKKILRYNKDSDTELINKAYSLMELKLAGMKRLSGKSYSDYYLDVASEIANLKLDDRTICASLLQGAVRGGMNLEHIRKEFGDEIYNMIERLNNINKIKKNVSVVKYEAESLRKLLMAISGDIRILFIKLCDKYVNMKDIIYLNKEDKTRVCREVLDVYSPLAYRIGLSKIKSELEDSAFKELEPELYKKIQDNIEGSKSDREIKVFAIKRLIEKKLKEAKINAEIYGRAKHIYSIYRKTIVRGYKLEDMRDLVALRIIVNSIEECYLVLRVVHNIFSPVPGRITDYIAMPKPNGYQSLHTNVMTNDGNTIEFQIRTHKMHEDAESGLAAHFSYKGIKHDLEFDKKLDWIKQLAENEKSFTNKELFESFKIDFFSDKIYVFSPKGKMVELPEGSCPLDFAYHIHSDLGDKYSGAKINNKMMSIKDKLNNGDIIEIVTNKAHNPSRDWLKYVKTTKARSKIRSALKKYGPIISKGSIIKKEEKTKIEEGLIVVENFKDVKVTLAGCCNPLPGDKISGVPSSNKRVKVHKLECEELKNANKKAIVNWKDPKGTIIEITIIGNDRQGLFAELINNISSLKINITDAKGKAINNDQAECKFKMEVENLNTFIELISKIKKINGFKNAFIHL